MFAQIKTVVDIVLSGFKSIREFKDQMDRDKSIEEMLCFYFLLKDCVDEGEHIIVEAGSNPIAKLKAMPPEIASETVERWDIVLRRQGVRLNILQGLLYGQSQLAVINPEIEVELSKAIGSKMSRMATLQGIGASLFLRCVFPIDETASEKAQLIAMMAGENGRKSINLERIRSEVKALRDAMEIFRKTVQQLATNAEIVKLSKKARKATRAPRE